MSGTAWSHSPGAVYVSTNPDGANAIAVYQRDADGHLEASGETLTGGRGLGRYPASQGSVTLSEDGRWLLAVNAGSDDLSLLAVHPKGLVLVDRVPSGGVTPVSVTLHEDRVCVLNAGAGGNIAGFRIDRRGRLQPTPGSVRFLSNQGQGPAPGPAQVGYDPTGRWLVVTERDTQRIRLYATDAHGRVSAGESFPSAGVTPYGFAFVGPDTLVVSEAFGDTPGIGATSSYVLDRRGLRCASPSVPTGESSACWVAASRDGRQAYVSNAGSGSLSRYGVRRDGRLVRIESVAGETGAGSHPLDPDLSRDGRFLYVLTERPDVIAAFAVQPDGSLVPLGDIPSPGPTSAGLAAW